MSHHVIRKGGVDGQPVASDIQKNEETKKDREENSDRSTFAFIDVEDFVQGISPLRNNRIHDFGNSLNFSNLQCRSA